jgi:hypothetical protein
MPVSPTDRDLDALLRPLDHPRPLVSVEATIHRAVRPRRRRLLAGAGIAAVLLAGVAVAMPWSGVQHWLAGGSSAVPAPPVPPPPAAAQRTTGISVIPGRAFDLTIEAAPTGSTAHVILVRDAELSVRCDDPAVGYSAGPAELRLRAGSAAVGCDVRVPIALATFRIRSGGVLRYAKDGSVITTQGVRQGDGSYVVALASGSGG